MSSQPTDGFHKRGLDSSTGYGLRFSTEIYGRKWFSTNSCRKLFLFLENLRKSPATSGSFRNNVI